ncbi:MAG: hypothetical protein EHM55_15115 [Acidobacteria bacterium]|nr:MAG: hypothetical protein EHM55_15115 [Acidobacteriota bacterium]
MTGARLWLIGYAIWSLLVSGWFFLDGRSADLADLSGDQINILTIAARKDHPDLLRRDLVVGNPADTAYYIPAFVDTVRLLSRPDHDYLRGLNVLLFLTSLLYMWGWWLLFSSWGEPLTAALLAFLARGILWPPGNELWGIAGLWTMLPRTLFLAALPWVLWMWVRRRTTTGGWLVAAMSCGIIVNIHPISGACIAAALLVSELAWELGERRRYAEVARRCAGGAMMVLVGASPFLISFWLTLGQLGGVDPAEFERATRERLSPVFSDVALYLSSWLQVKWMLLILMPWMIGAAVWSRLAESHRTAVLALGAFAMSCVAFAVGPVLVEESLRHWGHTPRFGFQLIRTGKYILAPSLIVLAMLCAFLVSWACARVRWARPVIVAASACVVAVTLLARNPVFDSIPGVGDEVVRQLWPPSAGPATEPDIGSLTTVIDWIRDNTSTDAGFIGPRLIRVGALRSVIHDFAGAVMLIEGNPRAYVATARRQEDIRRAELHGALAQARLFASWGADYWVTRTVAPGLTVAYSSTPWFVYDLRPGQMASVAAHQPRSRP